MQVGSVLFVLPMALANLALGYALAVHFKRRREQASVTAAAELTVSRERPVVRTIAGPAAPAESPAASEPSAPATTMHSSSEEIPTEWFAMLDESERTHSFVEAAVHVLRLDVGRYRDQLMLVEEQVRLCRLQTDGKLLHDCLATLKTANRDWMSKQSQAAAHLRERRGNLGPLAKMGERLLAVLGDQTAQIETTCNNIDHLDFTSDVAAGCGRLLREIGMLLGLAHALRDAMHESLASIVREEGRLGALDRRLLHDGLTDTLNRSGLEKALCEWWEGDPDRSRLASVALFDIDRCVQLNHEQGTHLADRVLRTVSRLLADQIRSERGFDQLARFSGQRFLILFGDSGPRNAMAAVERIRQTIEVTSFEHGETELTVAISAGVVEAKGDDTSDTLFARADATLAGAKRAGGNRTWLDEGSGPAAVVDPPAYKVRQRALRIAD